MKRKSLIANLIIAPLGFSLFALINIPFIDASGIVIRLCEIFMVDNGAGGGGGSAR